MKGRLLTLYVVLTLYAVCCMLSSLNSGAHFSKWKDQTAGGVTGAHFIRQREEGKIRERSQEREEGGERREKREERGDPTNRSEVCSTIPSTIASRRSVTRNVVFGGFWKRLEVLGTLLELPSKFGGVCPQVIGVRIE